jgi:hypothetical protein
MGIVPHAAAWAASFPLPQPARRFLGAWSGALASAKGGMATAAGAAGANGNGMAAPDDADGMGDEGEQELLAKMSQLLAALAGEIMDALKRVENGE